MITTLTPDQGENDAYHFAVQCPVESALLSVLRRFVSNVAEEMGFEEEDVIKIEMAVDEACSNVVLHAYGEAGPSPEKQIELKLSLDPEALTIHIQDRGQEGPPPPGPASLNEYLRTDRMSYHGMGIPIMKALMDEVRFQSGPEQGTHVTMCKYLHPCQPTGASGETVQAG